MGPNYHIGNGSEVEEGRLNTFIITAAHDKYIEQCLKSLNDTIDRDKHVVVYIEAPSEEGHPNTYDKVKDYIDIYVKTEKNYGFSKSVNLGLRWVYTPYFTVIHDDVLFLSPGWWEDCQKVLEEDDDLIMTQPTARNRREKDGQLPYPCPQELYAKLKNEARTGSIAEIWCMVFKTEWLEICGYFEERIYPVGPEDLEIYRQALSVNKRTNVTNAAVVYHKGVGREDGRGGPRQDFPSEDFMNEKWGGDLNASVGGLTNGDNRKPKFKSLIKQL